MYKYTFHGLHFIVFVIVIMPIKKPYASYCIELLPVIHICYVMYFFTVYMNTKVSRRFHGNMKVYKILIENQYRYDAGLTALPLTRTS